jgi:hypothetical protein
MVDARSHSLNIVKKSFNTALTDILEVDFSKRKAVQAVMDKALVDVIEIMFPLDVVEVEAEGAPIVPAKPKKSKKSAEV